MRTELLRFNGAVERAPAIDAWMREHVGELGDAPFAYVNVFTSHVNLDFFEHDGPRDPASNGK
jgi:hypothetical protein